MAKWPSCFLLTDLFWWGCCLRLRSDPGWSLFFLSNRLPSHRVDPFPRLLPLPLVPPFLSMGGPNGCRERGERLFGKGMKDKGAGAEGETEKGGAILGGGVEGGGGVAEMVSLTIHDPGLSRHLPNRGGLDVLSDGGDAE